MREPPTEAALLFRKELVPDIPRRGRKSNAARLTPDSSVDLVLVANGQGTGCFSGDKDRVAHLSAGAAVLRFYFLPEPDAPELELG